MLFRSCENVVTQPVPLHAPDLPLLIVGAHYDTVPDSPGADDNASAVAALIEVGRFIRPILEEPNLHARLQLISFDQEEYGFIGSECRVNDLVRTRQLLRGMISLEMLGFTSNKPNSQQLPGFLRDRYPSVANFIGIIGNESSADFCQQVTNSMKTIPGLAVESLVVPGQGQLILETRLSDHSPFWDNGYPAVMITDTSFFRNPHYHRSTDTPETIEYSFLTKVTAGVCQAVARLLTIESL